MKSRKYEEPADPLDFAQKKNRKFGKFFNKPTGVKNLNLRCSHSRPCPAHCGLTLPPHLGSTYDLTFPLPFNAIAHSHKNEKVGPQSKAGCSLVIRKGNLENHLKTLNVIKNNVKLKKKRFLGVRILTWLNFVETFLSGHFHSKRKLYVSTNVCNKFCQSVSAIWRY